MGGEAGDSLRIVRNVAAAEHAGVYDDMRIGLRQRREMPGDAGRAEKRAAAAAAAGSDEIRVRGDVAGDDVAERHRAGRELGEAGRGGIVGNLVDGVIAGAERDEDRAGVAGERAGELDRDPAGVELRRGGEKRDLAMLDAGGTS